MNILHIVFNLYLLPSSSAHAAVTVSMFFFLAFHDFQGSLACRYTWRS
jgi:hypothetical protein